MCFNQKYTYKINLPLKIVKQRIDRIPGIISGKNYFRTKGITQPMLGDMALIYGQFYEVDSETVLKVTIKLHQVGIIAICVGLFFGVIGLLLFFVDQRLENLSGLIQIGVIFPLVLINFSFDSGSKMVELKKYLNIK